MWRCITALLLALALPAAAWATDFSQALHQALAQAHQAPKALTQPDVDAPQAPKLLRLFMSDPPAAWRRVDDLRHWPNLRDQPGALYQQLTAPDPTESPPATTCAPPVPSTTVTVPSHIPEPLAHALRRALHGLALAEAWRACALAQWPAALPPATVLAQIMPAAATHADATTTPWPDIDHRALRTGMRLLLTTAEQLHTFVTQSPHIPPVYWRAETPLGTVLVDTTGRDTHHRLSRPHLVLDIGGNDQYDFNLPPEGVNPGVRLLLDHGGHDSYRSHAPGSDPSGAVLGYALLWDTEGDDDYHAGWLAQGAAVLGAAMHIDGAGHNRYHATGMAQGFALAGHALLLGSPGDDEYRALTLSQASAGPQGRALLLDPGGNDRYHLGNEVVVWPSSQLPDHNASMGQGAGFGASATSGGGLALLIDAHGDDSYHAQVFAQGAGLRQGLGALLDLGGHNRHRAAWYAMGAAAHHAVGVLWAAGAGDDRYEVSHVTAMGAGHDQAVGLLVDGGGHDRFVLGDLGLGAAHDGGHGVLVHLGGAASYRFTDGTCRGAGNAYTSAGATSTHGLGLLADAQSPRPCPSHPLQPASP